MGKRWTASDIFQLSGAYWSSCALQAAVQLDMFTALAEGGKSEQALAEELNCEKRAFAMLLTALTALGLVERSGAIVRASEDAITLLSRTSSDYIGFIVKHHGHIMPAWTKLTQAVHTGTFTAERQSLFTQNDQEREAFLMGMFNIARTQAERVADMLDLSGKRHLLDLGGGPGTYAVYFCKKNPQLRAVIFDLPTTEPFARKVIAEYGLADRVDFAGGHYLQDSLPQNQDAAWLSQVLHGERPEDAARLVKRAAECVVSGGLVCIQEFMLHDDGSGPLHPALFSLNMLIQTQGGQSYSQKELTDMLFAAGAAEVALLPEDLPAGARVLVGTMR